MPTRGLPLIVDKAWGAHLPFHPDLPTWAMDADADADLCVTSVLKVRADLLGTTSPSVLVYTALDV